MRRAQAILVIILLLSTPLSLLADSGDAVMAACNGMCCLPHHAPHSSEVHHPAAQYHEHQAESCEHGASQQPANCAMKCGHAAPDFGFLSPLAPTKPSNLASITRFHRPTFNYLRSNTQHLIPGFQSNPFQPPRA
jgi:hypothetical protein